MEVDYFRATVISDWDAGSIGLKSLTSWVDSNDDIFQDNDFVSGSVNGVVTGAFQGNRTDQRHRPVEPGGSHLLADGKPFPVAVGRLVLEGGRGSVRQ